jgi:hypothetical protein
MSPEPNRAVLDQKLGFDRHLDPHLFGMCTGLSFQIKSGYKCAAFTKLEMLTCLTDQRGEPGHQFRFVN